MAFKSPTAKFWQGKRVLLTGHTGFKGSWLTQWLYRLGAEVIGISQPPATDPSLFLLANVKDLCDSRCCDVRDAREVNSLVQDSHPDIVFHLAAQPLVRASYKDPLTTFATNVMGTANLLQGLLNIESVRVAIVVTTDKVYRNHEWSRPYRESDRLGGHDPYSASKAASELVIESYRDAFLADRSVAVASVRAGNVIGGGDWSEDRLIPDAVRAWAHGGVLSIRRPEAIRPWQHVLEPLAGYLLLAEKLWEQPSLSGAYNFGPDSREVASVRQVIELAQSAYGSGEIHFSAEVGGPEEAGWLSLETSKVRATLGYRPRWDLFKSIKKTMNWYQAHYAGTAARFLCEADIAEFEGSF